MARGRQIHDHRHMPGGALVDQDPQLVEHDHLAHGRRGADELAHHAVAQHGLGQHGKVDQPPQGRLHRGVEIDLDHPDAAVGAIRSGRRRYAENSTATAARGGVPQAARAATRVLLPVPPCP